MLIQNKQTFCGMYFLVLIIMYKLSAILHVIEADDAMMFEAHNSLLEHPQVD